jgi:hypothetical protein
VAQGYIHTVHRNGYWFNDIEGGLRGSKAYPSKDSAVAAGRLQALAARTEHIVHKLDGTFDYRNSYGHDPRRSVG